MGAGSSQQRLGERVLAAIKKLEADKAMQAERTARLRAASPETRDAIVQSITEAFERCAPFSEPTLLVAYEANPEEVLRVLTKSCKKVLSAPIRKDEYEWFEVCVSVFLCVPVATHFCTCVSCISRSATCSRRASG